MLHHKNKTYYNNITYILTVLKVLLFKRRTIFHKIKSLTNRFTMKKERESMNYKGHINHLKVSVTNKIMLYPDFSMLSYEIIQMKSFLLFTPWFKINYVMFSRNRTEKCSVEKLIHKYVERFSRFPRALKYYTRCLMWQNI